MDEIWFKGIRYKLTARKDGGQYSGPCPFTGEGRNRFTIEPATNRWFCRTVSCSASCTMGHYRSGHRFGFLDEREKLPIVKHERVKSTISPEMAYRFAESMNSEGKTYLGSRCINDATIAKFHIGIRLGKQITIPALYHWKGEAICNAIKCRWMPQYAPDGSTPYVSVKGSMNKCIFNFDALAKELDFVVVANSLFDVMTIDQLGIPVVGPFVGEGHWDESWVKYFRTEKIVNFGDFDEPKKNGLRPGEQYMLMRAVKLAGGQVKHIANVFAPEGHTDVNAAVVAGVDIKKFILETVKEMK
jgi:hypothetical protein